MNVRVTHADDDTIAWSVDQAGLGAYTRAIAKAPDAALGNAEVLVSVLQLSDRAFPVIAPIGRGTCWLTSLATTYGQAARDETSREVAGAQAAIFRALSHLTEALLRVGRADRAVYANHLLFSTSLYGDWRGEDLEPALAALRAAFPDRAIIWRSLNEADHAALMQRMGALGGRKLLSRLVWRIEDPKRDWAPRRDVRDDRALLATGDIHVGIVDTLGDDDRRRVLHLYEDLYLGKYSRTNPAYRDACLRAAIESGVLRLGLIRDANGELEGFTAEHVYQGTLVNPMLGYDRTRPQSRGLYRMAMAVSGERAIAEGLKINYSAGAAAFKRNRGARPALEFSMIFTKHLPLWRRLVYHGLAAALEAMAPTLERIAQR